MSRVDEYRRYAAECLRIAQATSDPEAKGRLLDMAQRWGELGKKAEEPPRAMQARTYAANWRELARVCAALSDSRTQQIASSRN
jgi:hypothetical protein